MLLFDIFDGKFKDSALPLPERPTSSRDVAMCVSGDAHTCYRACDGEWVAITMRQAQALISANAHREQSKRRES